MANGIHFMFVEQNRSADAGHNGGNSERPRAFALDNLLRNKVALFGKLGWVGIAR